MKLLGYLRVSRVGGREGESFISPDAQRQAVEAYAKAHGHKIVGWHEDLDQPGSTLARPAFSEALSAVRDGKADGIAASRLDRLTRSVSDLAKLLKLAADEQWNLIAVDQGLDLQSSQGKLVANILGSVAEWELDARRDSWQQAKAHAVERGVHVASRTPTGYRRREDKRLEPDPVAAPIVAKAFRERADGASWRDLAKMFEEAGLETPYGNTTWTSDTVFKIIRNPVYTGEARAGELRNAAAHESLVSVEEWKAAQSARASAPTNGDGALLAGLLRCAGCRFVLKGDKMTLRNGERVRIYRCREHAGGNCEARSSAMGRVIEPYVVGQFFAALRPGGILAKPSVASSELKSLRAQVASAEAELEAWISEEAIADLGRDIYVRGLKTRKKRVDQAQAELDELVSESAGTGLPSAADLRTMWPELSIPEQRSMLTAGIDAVMLRQGKKRNDPIEDRTFFLWHGQLPGDFPARGKRVAFKPFDWPES